MGEKEEKRIDRVEELIRLGGARAVAGMLIGLYDRIKTLEKQQKKAFKKEKEGQDV